MSIKTKIITAAAALTLIAGAGAAGTRTANAATPKCAAQCSDFYSRAFGTGSVPGVLHAARAGQPTALAKASRASQGEDFSVDILGQVHDFYKAGLVSGGLNALHGGLFVYEIEYTPGGSPSSTGTYYALISAATNRNFNRPYALTALVPGFPLVTAPLATGGLVLAHQLWSAEQGVLAAH